MTHWKDCLGLSRFTLTFGLEICCLDSFSVSSFTVHVGAREGTCPSGPRAKATEVYKCKKTKQRRGGWVKMIMRQTSKLKSGNKLLPRGHKTICAMRQYADKAHQMPVVRQRGRGEWTSSCLSVYVCVLYSRGTERMTQSHSAALHFIGIKNSG